MEFKQGIRIDDYLKDYTREENKLNDYIYIYIC